MRRPAALILALALITSPAVVAEGSVAMPSGAGVVSPEGMATLGRVRGRGPGLDGSGREARSTDGSERHGRDLPSGDTTPAPETVPQKGAVQALVERLDGQEPLRSAAWGVMAVDADGRVLASLRPEKKLMPASNMKLITTGCALHALGPERTFETRIGYSGTVRDGVLHGDVYIIGGADPTLGTADSIAVKTPSLFWRWKSQLKAAGISEIHGRIIGDGRYFDGHLENTSWEYDDLGTYYGAGGNGLSFYANAQDYAVRAGEKPGDPVPVSILYPETPWITFTNHGLTGPRGTGNSLYLYTTDLAPFAELRGTFAIGRRPKTEHFANKFGAMTCAFYFWKNLTQTGWKVSGGYADIDRLGRVRGPEFKPAEAAPARESLTVIGSTPSPSLKLIARETNHRSDNFYAETIFRDMGIRATGSCCYDSCAVALTEVLDGLGVFSGSGSFTGDGPCQGMSGTAGAGSGSHGGLVIKDGSGLSRHNLISPEFMVRFLRAMTASPAFPAFLETLPRPGAEGTLKSVLKDLPEDVRARIRMKSGSFDGAICYSGYILPAAAPCPTVPSPSGTVSPTGTPSTPSTSGTPLPSGTPSTPSTSGTPLPSGTPSTSGSVPLVRASSTSGADPIVFSILTNNCDADPSEQRALVLSIISALALY